MNTNSNAIAATTIGGVFAKLLHHPVENLLRRWNWKSAVLSGTIRGALFFATNIGAGLRAAVGAMALEAAFYVVVAGFYGALIESFRRAHPPWAANAVVMVMAPAINHSLELTLHWVMGTERLATSVTASITLSAFSAIFNLFAMRRGALIVGDERRSLLDDLKAMPRIVFEFFAAIPRALWRL
jgi:hypothetical protein